MVRKALEQNCDIQSLLSVTLIAPQQKIPRFSPPLLGFFQSTYYLPFIFVREH